MVDALFAELRRMAAADSRVRLNAVAREEDVVALEREHRIALPNDYRSFLLSVGNGASAPGMEIFPLGRCYDNDAKEIVAWPSWWVGDLATPFPHHVEPSWWTRDEVADEGYDHAEDDDDDALDLEPVHGALPLMYYGCNEWDWLVVTGTERGHVWRFDGPSNGPWGPFTPCPNRLRRSITFSDWVMLWANRSNRE